MRSATTQWHVQSFMIGNTNGQWKGDGIMQTEKDFTVNAVGNKHQTCGSMLDETNNEMAECHYLRLISLSLSLQLACFLNTHKRTHRPTYINGPVSVLPRYGVSFLLDFVVPYWYFLFSFSLFFYSTLGCTLFRNHLQTIECCHGNSTTNNNKERKKKCL